MSSLIPFPLGGANAQAGFRVEGQPDGTRSEQTPAELNMVSAGAPPVTIVNQASLGEFGGRNPIGVVVGLGVAVAATRLVSGWLFNTSTTDPVIYASLSLLLLTMAALACYVPARRAMRVDPMTALRSE